MAILVSSNILAISFGVYALTIKEIILTSFLRDSTLALSAADRAMECTLYWDRGYPANGLSYTIFPTSTTYVAGNPTGVIYYCDSTTINNPAQTGWDVPVASLTQNSGLTTFTLTYPDQSCADVAVLKEGNTSTTTIVTNGYNICGAAHLNDPRRTQRTIQVQGNF